MKSELITERLADGELPRSRWYVQSRWNKTHRPARRAHDAVAKALKAGLLKRGACQECGSLRVEAHHPDYSHPLDVIWLCRPHHLALHRELRRAA